MSLKMIKYSLLVVVDCNPRNSTGIIIDPFNNTKFGAFITFHCEESNNSITAECGSDGEWDPDLSFYNCGKGILYPYFIDHFLITSLYRL